MDITKIKDQVTEGDVGWLLKKAFWAGLLCGEFSEQLAAFQALHPEITLSISEDGIMVQYPSRDELRDFRQSFGGVWQKELAEYSPGNINYFRELVVHGQRIRLLANYAKPPPSCQIIEEEVDVPARKEMRKRIVCPEPNEDADILAERPLDDAPYQ
jgi:hypothetical protein